MGQCYRNDQFTGSRCIQAFTEVISICQRRPTYRGHYRLLKFHMLSHITYAIYIYLPSEIVPFNQFVSMGYFISFAILATFLENYHGGRGGPISYFSVRCFFVVFYANIFTQIYLRKNIDANILTQIYLRKYIDANIFTQIY